MKSLDRLERLSRHLEDHPSDYQARIALLKIRSDVIEYSLRQRRNAKLKRVAEIRRKYNEEREQRNRTGRGTD